jgi:hypothetical protein
MTSQPNERKLFKSLFAKGGVMLLLVSFYAVLSSAPAFGVDEEKLRTFLRGNDYWNVRLSPDGKHLSLLTQEDERNKLVILDLDSMLPTTSVRYEESKKIEITGAEWIGNNVLGYRTSQKVARFESPFATPTYYPVIPRRQEK